MELKTGLKTLAQQTLQQKQADLERQLSNLQSAATEEGKSSAGDKYETQREMINQSRDILEAQVLQLRRMVSQLERIPCQHQEQVREGALVQLPIGTVWVSISLGKLQYEGKEFILISNESPLFGAIKGLSSQEDTVFRGKRLRIEQVD